MARGWTVERLKALSVSEVRSLYSNARSRPDPDAQHLAAMIVDSDLLSDEKGGLPFDHPIMMEIEAICTLPDAIVEATAAAETGLPPLAGMEHRLVAALGPDYGGQYTTHHAGRCIADAMLARGWKRGPQKPMPPGFVAKTATTFIRQGVR